MTGGGILNDRVALAPIPPSRSGRLQLANWLASPRNPLTARVVVNHLWQIVFGAGLVRTPEDFGLQGEQPTHPGLMDWLAVELIESGWDLRHLIRLMVSSETFRQDSAMTTAMGANRRMAKGQRPPAARAKTARALHPPAL